MNETKTIQNELLCLYLHEAETYQTLTRISGILSIGMIPVMLILAVIALALGGNVRNVFLVLGILEICGFFSFGVSAVMGKQCRIKVKEYAAMLDDEKSDTEVQV